MYGAMPADGGLFPTPAVVRESTVLLVHAACGPQGASVRAGTSLDAQHPGAPERDPFKAAAGIVTPFATPEQNRAPLRAMTAESSFSEPAVRETSRAETGVGAQRAVVVDAVPR